VGLLDKHADGNEFNTFAGQEESKYEGLIQAIDMSLSEDNEVEQPTDTIKYQNYDMHTREMVSFNEDVTGASEAKQLMAELDLVSDDEDLPLV
jgi:hypothetical protein